MVWTWEDEKTLGADHLDFMAVLHRDSEERSRRWAERYRGHAARADEDASRAAERAMRYEQAAREVRGDPGPLVALIPPPSQSCGVATGAGFPCRRWVRHEGDRCWQHPEP